MNSAASALQTVSRQWWTLVVRGVLAILFGVIAFISPQTTILALVWLIGAYFIVDGVMAIIDLIMSRGTRGRWWMVLIEGIIGIVAGVLAFVWPGLTAVVLIYLIAAWAVLTGILEIVAAIQLRKEIEGEWILALGGILSIVLGVVLFLFPAGGAVALVWLIGAYAILFGILMIVLGFRLRGMQNTAPA